MNLALDSKKNGWVWLITLFCLLVGMLLAASLKTQNNYHRETGIPSSRFPVVAQALLDEKASNATLRHTIGTLHAQNAKLVEALTNGDTGNSKLAKELQKAQFMAGLVSAKGEGVEVTLRDSNKKLPADTDPTILNEYIIHDMDLRSVVNELLANGAEAISIKDQTNNQRVVSNTSIRCVGGVIQVNQVDMSPPFTICAIGPKDILDSALKMPGGMIQRFRYIPGLGNKMMSIRKVDEISVPAYSEDVRFKYAVQEKTESKQ